MDTTKTPEFGLQDWLQNAAPKSADLTVPPIPVVPTQPSAITTPNPQAEQRQQVASGQLQQQGDSTDALVPKTLPATDQQLPATPESDELLTKRPLAHFGQGSPLTKSKANRKLVLQLTPEMYQYFAHVATLPALDGVALSDLALTILQAWREDYRPEIKKANAAFKA